MRETGTVVVGTGFIGPVHVEALRRLGQPIRGILASSPEKGRVAAEQLRLPRAYADFDEVLADPGVGVVHLTTPNRFHFDQCRRALAAGKHILCEKPLAMTTAETAELVALAERTPLVAAVNYNVRYYPLCHEARQRIAVGEIGDIYHVTGSYVQDWLLYDTDFNWRVLPEEGGALRAVADIGTHWLDLMTWITGLEIEQVCSDLRTVHPYRQRPPRGSVETFQGKTATPTGGEHKAIATEDHGSALLRFRGGATGCCTVSQVTAGRKNCLRFEIAGSRATLAWNSERPDELWIGHRDRPNELLQRDPALLHAAARPFTTYPGGHAEGFPDTFKQLFQEVYRCVRAGQVPSHPAYPTFADGHREVVLCEAILRSHQQRAWVTV
jgi:predicted dehydrogenase